MEARNQEDSAAARSRPHIAILPTPGMGHLIPLGEFTKRLVLHHNFSVTLITNNNSSKAQQAFLASLPVQVSSIPLPPVPLDDLPSDVKIETQICHTMLRSLPSLRDALRHLKKTTHLVAFVSDVFGIDAFDVAREFDVSSYIFFCSNALSLSFFLRLPELDAKFTCEFKDLLEPIKLPGCIPIHGRDLLDPVQDKKNEAYSWVLHHSSRYKLAEGILVNSFEGLEPGPINALKQEEQGSPPVYAIGPLTQVSSASGHDESGCLRWLDEQPRGSVLFVSFGSGGTLSSEQLTELAYGLQMSGQRFLWVARSPSETAANATFFSVESTKNPLAFLPEGFLEKTKEVGMVVPSWVPQVEVLNHESTGGFLSHCGWNSALESVVSGIPMIAWPLYAEQKMNAVVLVEDVKVALRPRARGESGLVGREEVSRVVMGLMEGEEGKRLRSRVQELQEGAARAVREEGSSYKALAQVATKWLNSNHHVNKQIV